MQYLENISLSTSYSLVLLSIGILLLCGCATEEEVNNADLIPGRYIVVENLDVRLNGVAHSEAQRGYLVEFYDRNCAQLFDGDMNKTNSMKWAYQESEDYDRFVTTEQLNGSGGDIVFGVTRVSQVFEFSEEQFLTSYFVRDTVDTETVYTRIYRSYYTKI